MVHEKYGRLTVYSTCKIGKHLIATCICECGVVTSTRFSSLKSGVTTSCGCYAKEVAREKASTKEGISKHPMYRRWYDMNRRCYDVKRKDYKHYGGRGITVCEDWHKDNKEGFNNFVRDMESSYEDGLEIGRIDNNKGYSATNCKWSTRSEQMQNIRALKKRPPTHARYLSDGYETLPLADMARKYGLKPSKLRDRLDKQGMTLKEAVALPHKAKKFCLTIEGVPYKISDVFSQQLGAVSRKFKINTEVLLRSVFKDCVKVYGEYQGVLKEIHTTTDVLTDEVFRIKDCKFSKYFNNNTICE